MLAANFTVVAGMGGSPGTLAADAAHAAALGATELRLYHAGLASERTSRRYGRRCGRPVPPGGRRECARATGGNP